MSELQHQGEDVVALTEAELLPAHQQIGSNDIEITFLGVNASGERTWIMWNKRDPYLLGMLRQSKLGYHFEQRTSSGVMYQENISLQRVRRALGG